ncbi:hypothetical protein GCK32_006308 [Trichostrongylus colubriformis]|uniref:Uncharacterized protein n=1 Tax=Trichostrongylus colubriformis TaxID=6319 RepID=A0AAN8EQ12_TRICO
MFQFFSKVFQRRKRVVSDDDARMDRRYDYIRPIKIRKVDNESDTDRQCCLARLDLNRVRPSISTIPEERTDDIVSNYPRRNGRSYSCGEFSIMREISLQSSDFITDQKGSEDAFSLNGDFKMSVVRTSTPISHVKTFDFDKHFYGVSIILPEGYSARLKGPRAQESSGDVVRALEIQSTFEVSPASSSRT